MSYRSRFRYNPTLFYSHDSSFSLHYFGLNLFNFYEFNSNFIQFFSYSYYFLIFFVLYQGKCVFREYLNKEAATKETFDSSGWFITGDVATVGSDGSYRLLGRQSMDVIKVRNRIVICGCLIIYIYVCMYIYMYV